ncbi:hypothetical protein C7B65_17830 [Phormidesmis priestleyi ULC007]|uniref:Uncharacterized protein n=1 Tax=Phormidesmis priestleyi ULC007 TaxID=1920490 RepID=A0A2T1DBD4_9CYAN|nr:hypothetical protein C7B65_17830 [Phormidesmis priestleyi ULC007]PZO48705.1 MAG: hypothetical protein DCF14_16370 [Phormidesmis priestleyi]
MKQVEPLQTPLNQVLFLQNFALVRGVSIGETCLLEKSQSAVVPLLQCLGSIDSADCVLLLTY